MTQPFGAEGSRLGIFLMQLRKAPVDGLNLSPPPGHLLGLESLPRTFWKVPVGAERSQLPGAALTPPWLSPGFVLKD